MAVFNQSQEEKRREEKKRAILQQIDPTTIADDFPIFINRQELVRYLVRYELFKRVLEVKGSIVECGVYKGASLMLFAQLSAIFEPYAFNRKVIGFDTFEGFPHTDEKDGDLAFEGDLSDTNLEILKTFINLYDMNRPISHVSKIELIKGDALKTIPKYFQQNPYTIIALLYLDFDLYEPTKVAIETMVPRMPKGAILVFDELNEARWQGETIALFETLNIRELQIRKFSAEPHISYVVL